VRWRTACDQARYFNIQLVIGAVKGPCGLAGLKFSLQLLGWWGPNKEAGPSVNSLWCLQVPSGELRCLLQQPVPSGALLFLMRHEGMRERPVDRAGLGPHAGPRCVSGPPCKALLWFCPGKSSFAEAYLFLAQLKGAAQIRAFGLTRDQLSLACGTTDTKLPVGVAEPDTWP